MTILIANIGTSDLAVKIDDYYLPVRFDRSEPNLDQSNLTEDEKIIWSNDWRQDDIINKLCPEIGIEIYPDVTTKLSFRELTEKLLAVYEKDEAILVSIKGGTPQMQTALRLQAVASTISKQLFIDPQLSVKNILHGQPSPCQLTAYWKYMRNQNYKTVETLLERWDFLD